MSHVSYIHSTHRPVHADDKSRSRHMVTHPSIHPPTCSAHSKVVVVDDMHARTSSVVKISPGSQHRHACMPATRTYVSTSCCNPGPAPSLSCVTMYLTTLSFSCPPQDQPQATAPKR